MAVRLCCNRLIIFINVENRAKRSIDLFLCY